MPKARLLVKLVDESGKLVNTDARTLLGISELQTVYVKGKAQRDADGNLSVLASQVYADRGDDAPTAQAGADHDHDHHDHSHVQPGKEHPAPPSEPATSPADGASSGESS